MSAGCRQSHAAGSARRPATIICRSPDLRNGVMMVRPTRFRIEGPTRSLTARIPLESYAIDHLGPLGLLPENTWTRLSHPEKAQVVNDASVSGHTADTALKRGKPQLESRPLR